MLACCVWGTGPARAQDDPFAAPSQSAPVETPPSTPRAATAVGAPATSGVERAVVRVRAFDAVERGTGGPGRRLTTTMRTGAGVIVSDGAVVTSASLIGAAVFALVEFDGEADARVAYVVGVDRERGLALLSVPSARALSGRAIARDVRPGTTSLAALFFSSDETTRATPHPVTLRAAHESGRRRVVGAPASGQGALVVGANDTVGGVLVVELDATVTLSALDEVFAFYDGLRSLTAALGGGSAEGEALVRRAARTLVRAQRTTDDAALALALEAIAPDPAAQGVSLDRISVDAALLVAAAYTNLAELEDARGQAARASTLRRLARARVLAALEAQPALRARSAFATSIADAAPEPTPVAPVVEARPAAAGVVADAEPTTPTRSATPAVDPAVDAPRRGLTFTRMPRFFAMGLSLPFAPSADVSIGGLALDVSGLWLVPKGAHENTQRLGLAMGPSISIGSNGGSAVVRVGAELGVVARLGRKPGLFSSAAWVPGVFVGEGEERFTAAAFRARVGVAVGRFGVAIGYDVASPRGLYAYHALCLTLLRER